MRRASSAAWATWELLGVRRTALGLLPTGTLMRRLISSTPLFMSATCSSSSFSVLASQLPLSLLRNLCSNTSVSNQPFTLQQVSHACKSNQSGQARRSFRDTDAV